MTDLWELRRPKRSADLMWRGSGRVISSGPRLRNPRRIAEELARIEARANELMGPPPAGFSHFDIHRLRLPTTWTGTAWSDGFPAWSARWREHGEELRPLADRRQQLENVTARRLLLSLLNRRERKQLDDWRGVRVRGSAGGFYRVYQWGTVERCVQRGQRLRTIANYCYHPNERLPKPDMAAAYILWLKADERHFRRVAHEMRIA